MPAPAWERLDDFLDLDDFATTATIALQGGGSRVVTGIFDDPFMDAKLGEYDMDSSRPRLLCKAGDLVGVTRGDSVTIAGQAYDVTSEPQSTGDGMAVLEMALA